MSTPIEIEPVETKENATENGKVPSEAKVLDRDTSEPIVSPNGETPEAEEEDELDAEGLDDGMVAGTTFAGQFNMKMDTLPGNPRFANMDEQAWKNERKKMFDELAWVKGDDGKLLIQFMAMVFHDKDMQSDGTPKVPHGHFIVKFRGEMPRAKVIKAFMISSPRNCKVASVPLSAARYLTHTTDAAMNEGKYVYPLKDVHEWHRPYRDMIRYKFWERRKNEDALNKLSVPDEIGNYPFKLTEDEKYVDLVQELAAAEVLNGTMMPQQAKDWFIQKVGLYWLTKRKVSYDYAHAEYFGTKLEQLKRRRNLLNIYISGDGGTGKSTLALALGFHTTKNSVCIASPPAKDKTSDKLNMYKGEDVLIINEITAGESSASEELNTKDPHIYSPFPSRNSDRDFIGTKIIATNSIDPVTYANGVLVYDKGGSQYQDDADPTRIDVSNGEARNKLWQMLRRYGAFLMLRHSKTLDNIVEIHVFNLRYYDESEVTDPKTLGKHVWVGMVPFTLTPGSAPDFTDEVLSDLVRLISTDPKPITVGSEQYFTIDEYLDENGYGQLKPKSEMAYFIDDVLDEIAWTSIPSKIMHDLYKSYVAKTFPKSDQRNISAKAFKNAFLAMTEGRWVHGSFRAVGGPMRAKAPFIKEYDLYTWNYLISGYESALRNTPDMVRVVYKGYSRI